MLNRLVICCIVFYHFQATIQAYNFLLFIIVRCFQGNSFKFLATLQTFSITNSASNQCYGAKIDFRLWKISIKNAFIFNKFQTSPNKKSLIIFKICKKNWYLSSIFRFCSIEPNSF